MCDMIEYARRLMDDISSQTSDAANPDTMDRRFFECAKYVKGVDVAIALDSFLLSRCRVRKIMEQNSLQ